MKIKDTSSTIAVILVVVMSIVAIAIATVMAARGTPISDIFQNPEKYMGKEIVLAGVISSINPSVGTLMDENATYFLIDLPGDFAQFISHFCNVRGIVTTQDGQIAISVISIDRID